MRALVLVAHPDDETIFAGAIMLQRPEWDWTIVCTTYEFSHPRGEEFKRAVDALRLAGVNVTRAEMLGMADNEGQVIGLPMYLEWERAIASAAVLPEIVYTHNRRGDYGHGHHMSVNAAAHVLYPEAAVWEFYYPRQTGVGFQWRGEEVEHFVAPEKRQIMRAAYEHHVESLLYHLPEIMRYTIIDGQEMHTTCASS